MAIVGMFLGGSPGALIPAGQALLTLQWACQNPQDVGGASFSVTGQRFEKTIQADAGGRAEVMVPAPGSYSVSVTHEGAYMGDEPQKAVVESQKAYVVMFNGVVDQTVLFDQKIADMEVRIRAQLQEDLNAGLVDKQDKKWVESTLEADKSGYSEILVKADFGNTSITGSSTLLPITGKEYVNVMSMTYMADAVNSNTPDWNISTITMALEVSPNGVITLGSYPLGYKYHGLRLKMDSRSRDVSVDVGQWHGYGAKASGTIYDSYMDGKFDFATTIPSNLRFRVFVR